MAVLATKTVNDNLVYYDNAYPHRWLDAFGPNVAKVELRAPLALQAASSLAAWKTSVVNGSTIADVAGVAGGAFLITTDSADNDGVNIHPITEPFYCAAAWPLYFGAKFQISEKTQSELWVGLGTADDDWNTAAPDDYIVFTKADGSTSCGFSVAKNGAASTVEGVHTFVDATDVTLEFYYDGTNVYAYVNGVLAATVAASNAAFPDDEHMTPHFEFTTGDTAAETSQVAWIRAIQIQNP
jgi:hypothetical protein